MGAASAPYSDGGVRGDASAPWADASGYWDGGAFADAAPLDSALGPVELCQMASGCDPTSAVSCPEAESCVLSGAGAASCGAAGAATDGSPCAASSDCAGGLACFRRGEGGACARVCCPGHEGVCGDDGTACTGTGVLVDGTDSTWAHCALPRACNVLAPEEACEIGEGCYIVSATGGTDCQRAGTRGVGDLCVEQNDCAPGLSCNGITRRECARICALGDAEGPMCAPGEGECRAYSHSPDGTGICTIDSTTGAI